VARSCSIVFCRHDHGGSVDGGTQSAQHTAKAVVEGHGDADPVLGGHSLAGADVVGIQQQVAMAEHRGFGKSGGTGGVLDINRIAGGQLRAELFDVRIVDGLGALEHLLPGLHAAESCVITLDRHDVLQPRVFGAGPFPDLTSLQFGTDLDQHGEVVGRFELIDQEQGPRIALLQYILELERTVGGVDRYQHGPQAGGGKLQHDPLRDVRRPHAHMIAAADPQGHQSTGRLLYPLVEFAPAPSQLQVGKNDGVLIGIAGNGFLQDLVDGQSVNPHAVVAHAWASCFTAPPAACILRDCRDAENRFFVE
jgi:hypothetical protein